MQTIRILAALLLLSGSLIAAAADSPRNNDDADDTAQTMQFGLGRGCANLFLGWLELPRNFSYEFTGRPLSAIVIAPLMGTTLTAARAGCGLIDLLSLGYFGQYDYGAGIPDYPWEALWLAPETELY
jgi:hypothetical protein